MNRAHLFSRAWRSIGLGFSLGIWIAHPAGAAEIALPFKADQPVEYFEMQLDQSVTQAPLSMDLPLKTFVKKGEVQVKAGTELKVDTLVISEKLLAVARMQTWRTQDQMPGLDEVRDGLGPRVPEGMERREDFVRLLAKLAEERRFAQDPDELAQHLAGAGRNARRARFNPYLFPTGYIEVSGLDGQGPGKRYFMKLGDALGPAVQVDVPAARLKILEGLTLYLLEQLPTSLKADEIEKAKSAVGSGCMPEVCVLEGDRSLGKFMVDSVLIFLAGEGDDFSAADRDKIALRKQACLLRRLKEVCPRLPELDAVEKWVRKADGLNCDETDSILERK